MNIQNIIQLRALLHRNPEISGTEVQTKSILTAFLRENTSLELHPCGQGFYAAYRAKHPVKGAIALRADYDALALSDGIAAHLCGHDGHAAALCGAAVAAEGMEIDRDIYFLFQPAEETGQGAKDCLELFSKESVSEIYSAHNLPGFPLGQVVTHRGTFACASRGVILRFQGKMTHAAYPENGVSPSVAVGTLLCELPRLADPKQYSTLTMCTVIGTQMGERNFGSAAADAEVWLTLRSERDEDLMTLQSAILSFSKELAETHNLFFSHLVQDVFPATVNTDLCAQKVLTHCGGAYLDDPMRWSEDFGHYLLKCPGAYFGIGAGLDHPPLHTENYEYPDALLQPTIDAFLSLIQT